MQVKSKLDKMYKTQKRQVRKYYNIAGETSMGLPVPLQD